MPFKSKKQRSYLRRNKQDIYRRWVKKHGAKVGGRRRRKGQK